MRRTQVPVEKGRRKTPGLDQGAKRAGKKCAAKPLCSIFPCLVESKFRFYIGTCAARGANSLSLDHLMLQTGGTTASGRGFFE
jgi:hypothetical protein